MSQKSLYVQGYEGLKSEKLQPMVMSKHENSKNSALWEAIFFFILSTNFQSFSKCFLGYFLGFSGSHSEIVATLNYRSFFFFFFFFFKKKRNVVSLFPSACNSCHFMIEAKLSFHSASVWFVSNRKFLRMSFTITFIPQDSYRKGTVALAKICFHFNLTQRL